MRGLWIAGATVLLAGCVGTPSLNGTIGAPAFAELQQSCGAVPTVDYGASAQSVYSTLFDANVARRRGRISQEEYCTFQTSLAQHYAAAAASGTLQAQNDWAAYFLTQRVQALSWRAAVDPTLRGG
ncbi:hypothetical protein QS306_03465 [Paraburkholderia bonniea]|uniref:hypothetical protein n=1 Tax=Paraburkholderia bonniea TaxID=2152891 RepID=UPI0012929E90|nr:hypothetical protein [Paraburkholderia bonniea]WJF90736.1 hypothetical protein QS306_03465 [Paraburkholderia bonniea]WJF94050.1 hypothetical protein QS308_03465 [Paraburkholderia bonniea]